MIKIERLRDDFLLPGWKALSSPGYGGLPNEQDEQVRPPHCRKSVLVNLSRYTTFEQSAAKNAHLPGHKKTDTISEASLGRPMKQWRTICKLVDGDSSETIRIKNISVED